MSASGFTLFDTPIGSCAVAWGERGIAGLQLPEAGSGATRARMKARFPAAAEAEPPRDVKRVIAAIRRLLGGKPADFSEVALNMEAVTPFHRRVYETAREVPAGRTLSYGEIAARLGSPNSARAVGQALGRNPFPIVVPCHRVLAAGGKAGGFTAEGGVTTKMRMLQLEGWTDGQAAAAAGPDLVTAVRELRNVDPVLARLIDTVGPCTLQLNRTQSVFSALSEAVVYQQLTGKAAATIHGRVCALFPRAKNGFTPAHILAASDEALRGAGLSRAKVAALRDLARKVTDREIPTMAEVRSMSDDEIIDVLTTVRGVGRWTVEMLLIFRLGRPDVLPADDYGVRKGFAVTYRKRELPSRKDLEKHGEKKWKPWRTVASWYMWRAADLAPRRAASS
jgi:O-6-methylguanine DNA methyltransferase